MRRVLVVGAAGQLGAELVRAAGAREGVEALPVTRGDLDLTRDAVADHLDAHDFDVLINCAAYTRVDDAEDHAAEAFATNARGTAALADLCRRKGARFVTFSTDYVFDGRADRPYDEDAAPAPLNVYGASKLMGEALAREAWPEGTLVIRTASLFGIGASGSGDGWPRNFVESMIAAATEGRSLRVVDDITMSPTWTGHLAPAVLDLLERDAPAGTWHLAGDGAATWHGLAVAALEGAGVDAEVRAVPSSEYPTPAVRPRYSVLDCGRAAELGIRLPDWREGLAGYLEARPSPAEGARP